MKGSAGSRRSSLPALLLAPALLLPPQPAPPSDRLRFSADDVVQLTRQGYPQEEIIRLIRLSESRYVLSADEAVVLKQAGVSEPVIAEMLSRFEPRPVGLEKTEAPAPARREPAERPRSRVSIAYSGKELKVERRVAPLFAPSPEAAAPAVMLDGLEVLLLEGPAEEPSTRERAARIAERLNSLTRNGLGHFAAADSGAGVIFKNTDGRVVEVLAATRADAAAFARREGAAVSPRALASYWAALLNDYWSIAVAGKPARFLVHTPDGEALAALSHALAASTGTPGREAVETAAASLDSRARARLRRLASVIPESFAARRTP